MSLVLILAVSLFACSDERRLQDLHRYIEGLKKAVIKHKKRNDILAAIKFPIPAYFDSSKQRDPFENEQATYEGRESNNPLTGFPVLAFEFIGTVVRGQQTWAVIQAPDSKIYQVTINNRFGNHYGKIIAIYPDHIEVEEQVSAQETGAASQGNEKRIVTLRIKGES